MKNKGFNLLGKYIDNTKELEKTHIDYELRKQATLVNLKGLKVFFKQLHDEEIICDECYASFIKVINNTAKFIKEGEI